MPVDKHDCVKILPHPFDIPNGLNVEYLNFAITKAVVNVFAVILHAGRGANDMKKYQT